MTERTPEQIKAWLDELEARCNAATPGPWREGTSNVWNDDLNMPVASTERHTYVWRKYKPIYRPEDTLEQEQADAIFIAHARQDIPELIQMARRTVEAEAERDAAIHAAMDLTHRLTEEGEKLAECQERLTKLTTNWYNDLNPASPYRVEYNESDYRWYVYRSTGDFLWSGEPCYNAISIGRYIDMLAAAEAERDSYEMRYEASQQVLREVVQELAECRDMLAKADMELGIERGEITFKVVADD